MNVRICLRFLLINNLVLIPYKSVTYCKTKQYNKTVICDIAGVGIFSKH